MLSRGVLEVQGLAGQDSVAQNTNGQNSEDRRTMRRFDMRLPAIVRMQGAGEFHTETQNVSARGVYFYLDRAVEAGTPIEVVLTFPPHITLTDSVRVRFTARVIRVESPLPSLRIGTAAMIEDYEFLRSNGAPDFFSALPKSWKEAN
jgi:PilZ domain